MSETDQSRSADGAPVGGSASPGRAEGPPAPPKSSPRKRLRKFNASLEKLVAERTAELRTSVESLRTEIARRTLAEQALRDRSQIVEAFFRHTLGCLAVFDRQFNFVRVNKAYADTCRHRPEWFVGKNHFDLYPDEANQRVFADVVRTGKPYSVRARPFVFPDQPERGTTYWDWRLTPLLGDAGEVRFLVFSLEDVTERHRVIGQLEARAAQLRRLAMEATTAEERERHRLAEMLHDDLQQLLVALKLHVELLAGRFCKGPESRPLVSRVRELIDRSIEKTRDMSHEIYPPVLFEKGLIQALHWLVRRMFRQYRLNVSFSADGSAEPGDEPSRALLYRAAQELLFNIVKHAAVKEAEMRLCRDGQAARLEVADGGKGFDPEAVGAEGGDAGIGLLKLRERVDVLGGTVSVQSSPGRGSTFVLSLPGHFDQPERGASTVGEAERRAPSRRKRAEGQPPPSRKPGGGIRVLLVDDHAVMRQGLAALLGDERGVEVVAQAGNGKEAVRLAQELRPDVVVMDVSMPVMAGDEATRLIKEQLPETRVVGLSMYGESEVSDRMLSAGADACLPKAGPGESLIQAVRGG
jgi:PAS domain S-box-containing protein